jgi:hypothetical protein
MFNKTIQKKILELLFEFRLENKQVLSNIIIEKLCINSTDFDVNMNYLIEKDLLTSHNFYNGHFTDTEYIITAEGMDIITSESSFHDKSETTIHQVFKGEVGNVSGRDFTINNITTNIYLNALEKAIEKSDDISEHDKKNLVQKIRELKDDPMVRNLSTVAITEAIKYLLH